MEKLSGQEDDQLDMPPGFRFHPTDEELIIYYLSKKVMDNNFSSRAIVEVDMNKMEPWELPRIAKMGEKEWYFFCFRDKKYPTGLRTNRATTAGYWKATGKDKEIFKGQLLIGMKKTLVFYTGRAPKGEKTNWVIHEFRLEGKFCQQNLPKSAKTEWVICRVFHKSSGGKKLHISGPIAADSDVAAASPPPLIDSPVTSACQITNPTTSDPIHVHCFSNPIETQTTQKSIINNFINNPIFTFEGESVYELKMETEMKCEIGLNVEKGTREIEDQEAPSSSIGQVDLDCLWNY